MVGAKIVPIQNILELRLFGSFLERSERMRPIVDRPDQLKILPVSLAPTGRIMIAQGD
jgi:hypothetical protein